MDSLFGLLVIIGIFIFTSSGKKKKAQQKKAQQRTMHQPRQNPAPVQPSIPAEWANMLKGLEQPRPERPSLHMMHDDEPEGSISTQGESEKEHAEHREEMFAREMHLRKKQDELQDLRRMNLKKLRSAVVMSEVLNKPVSLRARNSRY